MWPTTMCTIQKKDVIEEDQDTIVLTIKETMGHTKTGIGTITEDNIK